MSNYVDYKNNNWLYLDIAHQKTITLYSNSGTTYWDVMKKGDIYPMYPASESTSSTRPVVYLKSSVKLTGGSGTQDSPYQISL